jgi:hypothetical protein
MGTSTSIALPRTGIGNLCVWVTTHIGVSDVWAGRGGKEL